MSKKISVWESYKEQVRKNKLVFLTCIFGPLLFLLFVLWSGDTNNNKKKMAEELEQSKKTPTLIKHEEKEKRKKEKLAAQQKAKEEEKKKLKKWLKERLKQEKLAMAKEDEERIKQEKKVTKQKAKEEKEKKQEMLVKEKQRKIIAAIDWNKMFDFINNRLVLATHRTPSLSEIQLLNCMMRTIKPEYLSGTFLVDGMYDGGPRKDMYIKMKKTWDDILDNDLLKMNVDCSSAINKFAR